MHNLHVCVVRSSSAEEAERVVESAIESWGDENNWRTICGSLSEDGVVHLTGEGRYPPDEDETVEKLNAWFTELVGKPTFGIMGIDITDNIRRGLELGLRRIQSGMLEIPEDKKDKSGVWCDLYSAAEYLSCTADACLNNTINRTDLSVFKDQYLAWKLSECGVTHIDDEMPIQPDREGFDYTGTKLYAVYVDMHS